MLALDDRVCLSLICSCGQRLDEGLALGGSCLLPDLFAAAGCKFQFDAATIKPLVALVRRELAKLV